MGVVVTVVVEADALVWNSDCRVAPARTLVLFPPSRFFRLCRCGTLLRGSTFPGNSLWAHVCSESCAHLSARAWYIRIGWCLPERRCFLFSSHHDTYVFTSALYQFVARCASLERAILLPPPAYMRCQKDQSPVQVRGIGEGARPSMFPVVPPQSSEQDAHRRPVLAWSAE